MKSIPAISKAKIADPMITRIVLLCKLDQLGQVTLCTNSL